jgi:hypothetical protein
LRICSAERVRLLQNLLQRLDETLHVGAEAFVRQPHGVAAGERLDWLRQFV